MVQTLGTNENNDLYLDAVGNLAVLSGIEAVQAACATATRAQLQEMVLATSSGIPNFQALWIGTPEYAIWKSYLLKTLQNVPGVQQVASLVLAVNGSTVNYKANVTTQYGQGTVNG